MGYSGLREDLNLEKYLKNITIKKFKEIKILFLETFNFFNYKKVLFSYLRHQRIKVVSFRLDYFTNNWQTSLFNLHKIIKSIINYISNYQIISHSLGDLKIVFIFKSKFF